MTTHSEDPHTHTHTLRKDTQTLGFGPDIPIFTKLYEFYKNLYNLLKLFPKRDRYTLGQKLDNLTLDILEQLLSIPYRENKNTALKAISVQFDLLKILIRLAKDNQCLTNKDYLILQSSLSEIGKMLGGWIKATQYKR